MHGHDYAEHMRWVGLHLLSHAIEHAVFAHPGNPLWNVFAVLHSAQAAEILLKSCIVEKDPSAIFRAAGRGRHSGSPDPDLDSMFFAGRTVEYSKLPGVLHDVTGYTIQRQDIYRSFGELRNQVQHSAIPSTDFSEETLRFAALVLDPLLHTFWDTCVMEHFDDDETDIYLAEALDSRGLRLACGRSERPDPESAR